MRRRLSPNARFIADQFAKSRAQLNTPSAPKKKLGLLETISTYVEELKSGVHR